MRSFLVRFLIFAAICGLLFGGWSCLLYDLEVQSYRHEVQMPDDTEVVVCGDSHLEQGFDARFWPKSFNFAMSAITLDQLELKVYGLLKANPQFHGTVVVDISPEKFFNPDVNRPLTEAGTAGKRLMLHLLYPEVNRRPLTGMVKLFRDAILVKRSKKAWRALVAHRPYRSSFGGVGRIEGATPSLEAIAPMKGFELHPELVEKGIDRKAKTINGFPSDVQALPSHEVIANIVRIIREHKCRPLIVSTPLHERLLAEIDTGKLKAFESAMPLWTAEWKVPYVDCTRWSFPDDCWRDGNHLNEKGAALFTIHLKKAVAHVL